MFFCKRYGLSLASTYFLKTWWPFLNPWISNLSIRIHPSTKSASLMCNPSRCMACRFVDSSIRVWRCVASWVGLVDAQLLLKRLGHSGLPRLVLSEHLTNSKAQSEIWKHSMWKWPKQEKSPTIYDALRRYFHFTCVGTKNPAETESRVFHMAQALRQFAWRAHAAESWFASASAVACSCGMLTGSWQFHKMSKTVTEKFCQHIWHIETILSPMQRQTLYPS